MLIINRAIMRSKDYSMTLLPKPVSQVFFAMALFFIALLSFACGNTKPTTTSSILGLSGLADLQERVIKIAVANDYVPLNFTLLGSNKGIGWEYDAVAEIAKRLNASLVFELVSWDKMLAHVASGKVDMGMNGIGITQERRSLVDFSDPYLLVQQLMLVRSDETRFSDVASFVGNEKLLIGSQTGTSNFGVAVNTFFGGNEQNPRIKLFDNFDGVVDALLAGNVDLILMDSSSSRGYLAVYPEKLKLVGQPLGLEELGFVFPKGHELKSVINSAIAALKADGTFEALSTRWFYEYLRSNSLSK